MRKASRFVCWFLWSIPVIQGFVRHVHPSNAVVVMTGSQRQQQAIDRTSTFALRHKRGDEQSVEKIQDFCSSPQRRRLLLNNVATIGSAMLPIWGGFAHPCEARGLVQFPCDVPLANTYHLVRAGTSLLEEEEGIWSTNPLFLTNRDDALSETGEEQVLRVAEQLRADDRYPTVVKYSLAARCIDTANLIGRELRIGRNNLVPEFTFLDPRGLGGWDMTKYDTTYPAVLAFDNDQAGPDGLNARPISNEDGTPHETLSDVAIRLRQLMSILESQYSGETILLVFPDGTGPALLSAMVAGIPYNRVHELEFAPGELRVDVTKQSTLELWKQKRLENAEKYQSLLKQGRANLKNLQEGKGIKNLKDARIEAERIAIDKAYEEKERRRALALQREEELRLQRQKELRISSPDGDREIPPILLGTMAVTAAIGGIGLAAVNSRQGRRDNMSVVSDNTEKFTPNSNSTLGFGLNETLTPMLATVTVDNSEPLRVRSNMDGGSVGAREGGGGTLFSSNSFTRQRVNGDRNSLVPTVESPVMQDPKEAAKRAMEEYMNRDDGSSDWLMSLTEILQEEDDTDDDAASAIQDAMMQNSTKDEQTFQ